MRDLMVRYSFVMRWKCTLIGTPPDILSTVIWKKEFASVFVKLRIFASRGLLFQADMRSRVLHLKSIFSGLVLRVLLIPRVYLHVSDDLAQHKLYIIWWFLLKGRVVGMHLLVVLRRG